jgi:uncharacterized protein (TIGR02466 family)
LGGKLAFKLDSVDDIFPTPLLRFEVADAGKFNRALMKEIAKRQQVEGGMTRSNRKGWHSERDLFERKEQSHAALAQMLLRMMAQATQRLAPNTDFTGMELVADGWINVNPRGAYNSPHDHVGGFWSGVYYVQQPDGVDGQSGTIEFLAPHKPVRGRGMIDAAITAEKVTVRPSPGTVLIFPCTLVHWVHPNDSDTDRVTIAFNGHFRRRQNAGPGHAILSGKK